MNADLFRADVLAAPARLEALLDAYDGRDSPLDALQRPAPECRSVLLLGMGSSRFAAETAAAALRAKGVHATTELASTGLPTAPAAGLLAVGISASGSTPETVEALARHRGIGPTLAVTNDPAGALAGTADHVLPLHAGVEEGGVACLTFQATVAALLLLAGRLTDAGPTVAELRPAVAAAAALRDGRDAWLESLVALLTDAQTISTIAPAERSSSAEQSALMFREGPRLDVAAAETGDWLHVDVYLTKRPGYAGVLYTGSRFDTDVLAWARERGSAIVTVGSRSLARRSTSRSRNTRSCARSWRPGWRSSRRRSCGAEASQPAIPRSPDPRRHDACSGRSSHARAPACRSSGPRLRSS